MSTDDLFDLIGTYDNLSEAVPSANSRATLLGTVVTFLIISWGCALFRFYTRFFVIYSPGWDDFFLLLVLGYYIANGTYILSTTFIKISLLLQYLRVFEERTLRLICWSLLIVSSVWGMIFAILAWIPCAPVYEFWDLTMSRNEKNCYGYGSSSRTGFVRSYLSHASFNMTIDIFILSLPVWLVVRKTNVPTNRLGLVGLLGGGCVVVFVSIWRLASLVKHQAATYPTFDPTWYSPISIILSAIEVDVASICASIPVFWPVLTNSVGEIFVTKEVHIIHEERGDEFELHLSRSGSGVTHSNDSRDYPNEMMVGVSSHTGSKQLEFNPLRSNPLPGVNEKETHTVIVRTRIRNDNGAVKLQSLESLLSEK
ncbi:hypothetical protein TruAng_000387 [Truncatella angustata]|nr:hypothetical protein TruAng_000387 [Truncatella angustata]